MERLQEIRAQAAQAREALKKAAHRHASVEADLTHARRQLEDLQGQLLAGARVSAQLAALAARLDELEARRDETHAEVEAAREQVTDAETEEHEHINEVATQKPASLEDSLARIQEVLDTAQTEAVRDWARVAKSFLGGIIQLTSGKQSDTPAQTLAQSLTSALMSHMKLYTALTSAPSSTSLSGTLHVPDDAELEPRGTSVGGREKLHWETPVEYRGRRGTAYVEIYLPPASRR